jgi:hypothetical protein
MGLPAEEARAAMRVEVQHALRLLVEEATQQGHLGDLFCFSDVFVVFLAVGHPVISEAVASEMVTIAEVSAWLEALLYGVDGR